MEVISISDTSDESNASITRKGSQFESRSANALISVKESKIFTEDEVISLSSGDERMSGNGSKKSSETQRCPVTWTKKNKLNKLELPNCAPQDYETPSPQKKVNTWMVNHKEYLFDENFVSKIKFPFTEQHLDSLAASTLKICNTPQSDRKSSILVRQDYKKTHTVGSDAHKSDSNSTCIIEKNLNMCKNINDSKITEDHVLKENSSSLSINRSRKGSSRKRERSRSSSKLSLTIQTANGISEHLDECIEEEGHLNYNASVCKRSRSSSKSSLEAKTFDNEGRRMILYKAEDCAHQYNSKQSQITNNFDVPSDSVDEHFYKNVIQNKSHRSKSKSLSDVPLSPETQKKNELCSYLQLMNTNVSKNQEILQNRRSSRVKNHQKLMEKRKIEEMLNVKEPKIEETCTKVTQIDEGRNMPTCAEKSLLELQKNSFTDSDTLSNTDSSKRSATRKSFAELKMDAFNPTWSRSPTNGANSLNISLTSTASNEEHTFDEIMQDYIRRENINLSKIKSNIYNERKVQSSSNVKKSFEFQKDFKNVRSMKKKNSDNKVKKLKSEESVERLRILQLKSCSTSKEKTRKKLKKYWQTPQNLKIMRTLRSRIKLRNKGRILTERVVTKAKKKICKSRTNNVKYTKCKNLSNSSVSNVKIESVKDRDSLHMNRIDYKNQSPVNTEAQINCKDLTLNKRFPLSALKNNLEKRDASQMFKISPMLHEKLKSQFELLKNLTPEHRKALFESMRFINWNLRNGQSTSPKTDTNRVFKNCDTTLKNSSITDQTEPKLFNEKNIHSLEDFYGFKLSEALFSREILLKRKESLSIVKDKIDKIKKELARTEKDACLKRLQEETDSQVSTEKNLTEKVEKFVQNGSCTTFGTPKNKKDDVIVSVPDSNTPEIENRNRTHPEPSKTDANNVNDNFPVQLATGPMEFIKDCSAVSLSSSSSTTHMSHVINHTSNMVNSAILSPILSYVAISSNNQNNTTLLTMNSPELMKKVTTLPTNCSYFPNSFEKPTKSLNCYLNQTRRKSFTVDSELNVCTTSESSTPISAPEVQSRLGTVQPVCISKKNGSVIGAFYFDFTLVVVQESLISFWKVCPLGNVLGAHDMWEAKGSIDRLSIDNSCSNKITGETVMFLEKSVAYVEVWAKEDSHEIDELPGVDVFTAIYFWTECSGWPDNKLVQLERLKCKTKDIHYIVMKRSRKIIVAWKVVNDNIHKTFVHKYVLASDYQSVTDTKQMSSINYCISSMHNIQDCDTLIMGCGEQKITLWNVEYGFVVATIDLIGITENPRTLWSKCDRGFLFVLQQFSDGVLKLIAINGINYTWKQLRSFKPNDNSGSLQGVCMENGILVAFYDNVIVCWKVENKEVILEFPCDDNVKLFISDRSVISVSDDRMQVRNALQYLLTSDDIYNT